MTEPEKPKSGGRIGDDYVRPSARVHRVFHRIGAVGGGTAAVVALILVGLAIWGQFAGPTVYSDLSEIPSYKWKLAFDDKPGQDGRYGPDVLVAPEYSDKMLASSEYVAEQNASQAQYHSNQIDEGWMWAGLILAAGMIFYAIMRALGWIIAGAFS